MKFESLRNMKFQTLEKEQLSAILGGADECTPGGKKFGRKYSSDCKDGDTGTTYYYSEEHSPAFDQCHV